MTLASSSCTATVDWLFPSNGLSATPRMNSRFRPGPRLVSAKPSTDNPISRLPEVTPLGADRPGVITESDIAIWPRVCCRFCAVTTMSAAARGRALTGLATGGGIGGCGPGRTGAGLCSMRKADGPTCTALKSVPASNWRSASVAVIAPRSRRVWNWGSGPARPTDMPVASDRADRLAFTGPAGMSMRYSMSCASTGAGSNPASVNASSADTDAIAFHLVGKRHEVGQINQKPRSVTNRQHPREAFIPE